MDTMLWLYFCSAPVLPWMLWRTERAQHSALPAKMGTMQWFRCCYAIGQFKILQVSHGFPLTKRSDQLYSAFCANLTTLCCAQGAAFGNLPLCPDQSNQGAYLNPLVRQVARVNECLFIILRSSCSDACRLLHTHKSGLNDRLPVGADAAFAPKSWIHLAATYH